MSARTAPVLLATLALLAVAACAAAAPASIAPSFTPVTEAPRPTPIASPTLVPDPNPTPTDAPTPTPIIGDVDGATGGPELTIEAVDADTIQVILQDPAAKAWRVVVAGTGQQAHDRWEINVETGDVEPVITATEIHDDQVVDTMDLSGFGDGTAAAGGCHPSLGVCLDSDGLTIPADGEGHFAVCLCLTGTKVR